MSVCHPKDGRYQEQQAVPTRERLKSLKRATKFHTKHQSRQRKTNMVKHCGATEVYLFDHIHRSPQRQPVFRSSKIFSAAFHQLIFVEIPIRLCRYTNSSTISSKSNSLVQLSQSSTILSRPRHLSMASIGASAVEPHTQYWLCQSPGSVSLQHHGRVEFHTPAAQDGLSVAA